MSSAKSKAHEIIKWQISVPIFNNTFVLRQLGVAVGIPFGLLAVILVHVSDNSDYLTYALIFIGVLLFFTWLFIMLVYRGKYEVEFVMNRKGVFCRTMSKQAKKNRIVNTLTIILGLFSSKPTVVGVGMLAQSRQEVFLRWKHVRKVAYRTRNRTILLRGGWTEKIILFCTEKNYLIVEQAVKCKTKHLKGS